MPGVIGSISRLFQSKDGKGIVEQVTDSVGSIIDKYHVSPEDKQAWQNELDKKLKDQMDLAETLLAQDVANTNDARTMNEKIQGDKPTWLAKNMGYFIDIILIAAWLGMTFYIIAKALKLMQVDKDADFNVVLGIYSGVTAMATTVVNFHRGSSQGSVEKSKTIDRLTQ